MLASVKYMSVTTIVQMQRVSTHATFCMLKHTLDRASYGNARMLSAGYKLYTQTNKYFVLDPKSTSLGKFEPGPLGVYVYMAQPRQRRANMLQANK